MKSARVICSFIGIAVIAVILTISIRRSASPRAQGNASSTETIKEQVFTVRGQIISLDVDSGIVKIAHEEIPNYMPAMTMPFMVRDSNSLRTLKPGDPVTFKLAVNSKDSWVTEIEKRTATPSPIAAAPSEQERDHLKAGEKVPEFKFIDQNGKNRSSSEFGGKYLVLTFIYTRCPLPNFCPLLSDKFGELQERLGKEFPGQFHLLSVTIDPVSDTPEILKKYGKRYHADESTWTFATGSQEQISTIADLFGLTFSQKTPGLIDHDMRTGLIGPDGRVIHIWKSNFWNPYEIRNRIDDSKNLAASKPQ